ncbi:pyridoxamine 5'-phosphate oxidase family protein [Maribacter sp. 2210JD10-5]|uniref:pyridoxamine 5'-phosphate oxidase family protein n=1 Tax=Maribacter sp. 2210JD10-5 TaxID=3386272 RepID=UPI0039BD0850
MVLTEEIKEYIDKSVLCWLATVSEDGMPNVSPKECFNYFGSENIIVANIASPQSVKNIKSNPNICLSFIDIFEQMGYQIKGKAEIIGKKNSLFLEMESVLTKMTGGKYPFSTITYISPEKVKPIIAPKYVLYPETTVKDQIESAKKTYGI